MLPFMVTVKTALLPAVTFPALLIENVGADAAFGRIVAVPVVNAPPNWVLCRPTLKVSEPSVELPELVSVGIRICCVFDPPGLNVRGKFTYVPG